MAKYDYHTSLAYVRKDPRDTIAYIKQLRQELARAGELLREARCPDNCENGYLDIIYNDSLGVDVFASTECPWCAERKQALEPE